MVDKVTQQVISAADVLALESQDAAREIIHGHWAEQTEMAGKRHGRIATRIIVALENFIAEQQLGEVYPDNTSYVLEGTKKRIITMRIPDVSFVAAARVDHVDPGFYYIAPDLAVEILSPSETSTDTAGKIRDYLRFGTQQVWVFDPDAKTITVHAPNQEPITYNEGQTLPGGATLPGFSLLVEKVFRE